MGKGNLTEGTKICRENLNIMERSSIEAGYE